MPFLPPNQQRQSTEGKINVMKKQKPTKIYPEEPDYRFR